jgi:MFS family permease
VRAGAALTARSRSWRSLWLALFAVAFGAGVPVPLLLVYREELDLSATTLTLAFGVYAVGLVPAVLAGGPASDRYGRRRLVLPAAALTVAASLVFLAAETTPAALLVGRFLQGIAAGVVFSVGSTWMQDLSRGEAPGLGGRRAAAALSAGFALGPLVSGALGAWAPAPLTVPYLVHVALLLPVLPALLVVTETGGRRRAGEGRLLRLALPRHPEGRLAAEVLLLALWVFTLPTIAVNALPVLLGEGGGSRVALNGAVIATAMLSGAAIQPLGRRAGGRSAPAGLLLGVLGLGLGVAVVELSAWPLVLPTGALLGGAYGLCLAAGLNDVDELSEPDERGAVTATFYALSYVGMGAPFLIVELSGPLGATATLAGLAALVAATAAWLSAPSFARRRAVQLMPLNRRQ